MEMEAFRWAKSEDTDDGCHFGVFKLGKLERTPVTVAESTPHLPHALLKVEAISPIFNKIIWKFAYSYIVFVRYVQQTTKHTY